MGAKSGHFDGERFFNPVPFPDNGLLALLRWRLTGERADWPDSIEVTPVRPPASVEGMAMRVTMIGHATLLVQTQGLNILTDPVWSERASPFASVGPKRVRAPGVRFADLPKIDVVLVSHNHYDHLDLDTLQKLWERDRPVIVTPLGNATLMRERGITAFAGDWGYDASAFREAARRGPVRLALLPIGAYEPRWFMKYQHTDPAEAVAAFRDLRAAHAVGMHWGTFQLTDEALDAPPAALSRELRTAGISPARFPALKAGESLTIPAVEPDR